MAQGIIRGILMIVFAWMIGKGWVTKDQVDSNIPTIINVTLLAVTLFGGVIWSYLEKLLKGHVTWTGQTVSFVPDVEKEEVTVTKTTTTTASGVAVQSTALPTSHDLPMPPAPPKPPEPTIMVAHPDNYDK